ncbi:MAG: adenosylcobinamide-GDP ribazoletransferase [Acidimicrobiales bacterium]|jgi:adenosylcobinamide-GDP ribazoletransferase
MSALAFLTVVGRSRAPGARTLPWFPMVGATVGATMAMVHWGAHQVWTPLVAGALVVTADLALTGALHLDGLADSADGLLPHMNRDRRLAVMAEPESGVFAVAVVVTILMIRWSLLADPAVEPLAFVAVWAISRTAAAVVPSLVPYARPAGLVAPFLAGSHRLLGLWVIPATATLVAIGGAIGAAAVVASMIAAGGVVALALRRLGGFTGDILGAVILVSETMALLVLAVQA